MAPTIRLLLFLLKNLLDVRFKIQESRPVKNKVQKIEYEVWLRVDRIGHQVLTELEKFVR